MREHPHPHPDPSLTTPALRSRTPWAPSQRCAPSPLTRLAHLLNHHRHHLSRPPARSTTLSPDPTPRPLSMRILNACPPWPPISGTSICFHHPRMLSRTTTVDLGYSDFAATVPLPSLLSLSTAAPTSASLATYPVSSTQWISHQCPSQWPLRATTYPWTTVALNGGIFP